MENTPHLYETLVRVLSHHPTWLERRHLQTLAWMMVGLRPSGWITLTAWAPYGVSRAPYAQRTVRRFRRWLDNAKRDGLALESPLIPHAFAEWGEQARSGALDTSMWWETYCLSRLAVIYRDRAVPLVGCVRKQGSAQVSFEAYPERLEQAAVLLPRRGTIILLAERGVADTALMAHRHRLGWHGRIRLTRRCWLYRPGRRRGKVERLSVARGHACFWPQVSITENRYGPVSLAVAHAWPGQDVWDVLSDAPPRWHDLRGIGGTV